MSIHAIKIPILVILQDCSVIACIDYKSDFGFLSTLPRKRMRPDQYHYSLL